MILRAKCVADRERPVGGFFFGHARDLGREVDVRAALLALALLLTGCGEAGRPKASIDHVDLMGPNINVRMGIRPADYPMVTPIAIGEGIADLRTRLRSGAIKATPETEWFQIEVALHRSGGDEPDDFGTIRVPTGGLLAAKTDDPKQLLNAVDMIDPSEAGAFEAAVQYCGAADNRAASSEFCAQVDAEQP